MKWFITAASALAVSTTLLNVPSTTAPAAGSAPRSVNVGVPASTAAAVPSVQYRWVRCGADMHGQIRTRIPRTWTRVTHQIERCSWVAPSGDQRLVLWLGAPEPATERHRRSAEQGTGYAEHCWLSVTFDGNQGRLWDYGLTRSDTRERIREIGTHSFRIIYRAQHGTFDVSRFAFLHARVHAGLSG